MKIVLFLACILVLVGCGASRPTIDLNLLKAQGDVQAAKFQADKVSPALPIALGSGNQASADNAGRDQVSTTTTSNDTELMKYIIKVLSGLCATLIAGLMWCLKTLIRREKEKKFFKERTLLNIQTPAELATLKSDEERYVKTNRFRNNK